MRRKMMIKKYKVRVFYNAWQDMEVYATGKHELKEITQSLDADDVTLQYDFFEILEEEDDDE
jgi:hypothetical protein